MADLVWLASYPRSGNTWLRVILGRVLGMHHDLAIPSVLKGAVPEAPTHHVFSTEVKIIKTHAAANSQYLWTTKDRCVGVITIFRHPLDVLLSMLNYAHVRGTDRLFKGNTAKSVENIVRDGEIGYYIDAFIEADGIALYRGSGPWSRHQRQWDDRAASLRYHRIRYEDMVARPHEHFIALFNFLSLHHTKEQIDDVFRAAEEATKTGRFFWRKRAFNYLSMLDEGSINRFNKAFEEPLTYLGYAASDSMTE